MPNWKVKRFCTAAMLDGRNNRFFFPWEQMFFLMQIIFIVLPSNIAAVQNLHCGARDIFVTFLCCFAVVIFFVVVGV